MRLVQVQVRISRLVSQRQSGVGQAFANEEKNGHNSSTAGSRRLYITKLKTFHKDEFHCAITGVTRSL